MYHEKMENEDTFMRKINMLSSFKNFVTIRSNSSVVNTCMQVIIPACGGGRNLLLKYFLMSVTLTRPLLLESSFLKACINKFGNKNTQQVQYTFKSDFQISYFSKLEMYYQSFLKLFLNYIRTALPMRSQYPKTSKISRI